MRVLVAGHHYELNHLDGQEKTTLQFVSRAPRHEPIEGVTMQEVLRVLIDRNKFLDNEKPWSGNAKILHHLRMALVLHESRALERKVEKGEIEPEFIDLGQDGHFQLSQETYVEVDKSNPITEFLSSETFSKSTVSKTKTKESCIWPTSIEATLAHIDSENIQDYMNKSSRAFVRRIEFYYDTIVNTEGMFFASRNNTQETRMKLVECYIYALKETCYKKRSCTDIFYANGWSNIMLIDKKSKKVEYLQNSEIKIQYKKGKIASKIDLDKIDTICISDSIKKYHYNDNDIIHNIEIWTRNS